MATWLLFGLAREEGVIACTADESEVANAVGDVEDGSVDERELIDVEVSLGGLKGRVVCIVTGYEPKEKSADVFEQHPKPWEP